MQPHQAGAEPSASAICPQQRDASYSNHTCKRQIMLLKEQLSNGQTYTHLPPFFIVVQRLRSSFIVFSFSFWQLKKEIVKEKKRIT